nr:hypothetical protein [Arthrospira sp. PLM2.Bin9]
MSSGHIIGISTIGGRSLGVTPSEVKPILRVYTKETDGGVTGTVLSSQSMAVGFNPVPGN